MIIVKMNSDKLLVIYPNAALNDDHIMVEIVNEVYVVLYFGEQELDSYVWSTKNIPNIESYTTKLISAITHVNSIEHDNTDKQILILNNFKDSFCDIPGFDLTTLNIQSSSHTGILQNELLQTYKDYDGNNDNIWQKLISKFNVDVNRKLHIVTWGTAFILDKPEKCQHVFHAGTLRGSTMANTQKTDKEKAAFKLLLKLRGTNPKIQQEVREATLFVSFMEKLVETIENENLHTIGIVCTRGHHRSVSCAEMLKYLYINRTVEHLTIEQ